MIQEKAIHKTVWVIRKYNNYEDYITGNDPYDIVQFEDNSLLNEGITRLQNLLTGGGGTNFGNANAWLGVGTSSGSVSAVQTGLSGSSVAYRPMEATYPQISSQTTTWRSVFDGGQANFQWQEFTVANGSGNSSENLNRRVSDQGIKASGSTWTLDLSITWS
jgi:hypothetical protein